MAASCALFLAACSQNGPPYPAGWTRSQAGADLWVNPRNASQTYVLERTVTTSETIKDLASELTIDVILRNHGAKFVSGDLFASCPGSAGIQTFTLPAGRQLQVAFALWNGKSVEASYRAPRNAPTPPEVTDAMAHAVCSPS